jgi:hypothetical protein
LEATRQDSGHPQRGSIGKDGIDMTTRAVATEEVAVLPRREVMALVRLNFGSILVQPRIGVVTGVSVANAIVAGAHGATANAHASQLLVLQL